jgi:Pentapeptide repeats (9 copies)
VLKQNPAQEELQVRQTVQRILAIHLQPPEGRSRTEAQRRRPSPRRAFWPGISLDLTGAALVDFNFTSVSVVQAQFNEATFHDDAAFNFANFHGHARFDEAIFHYGAGFNGATFHHNAAFNFANFHDHASFDHATFQGAAWFSSATFQGAAWFSSATFQGAARFDNATFHDDARFDGVNGVDVVLHVDDRDSNKRRVWPDDTLIRAYQAEEPEPAGPPLDRPADDGLGTG